MTDQAPTIEEEVLSDLAHKLVDQVALYGLAKDLADDPAVIEAIQRTKEARAQLLQDINAKIWLLGHPPIEQGTKLGSADKAFLRLKSAPHKDNAVAISEVARGEIYMRDRIARASDDARLTSHTRNYLQTLLSKLSTTNAEIFALHQQLD